MARAHECEDVSYAHVLELARLVGESEETNENKFACSLDRARLREFASACERLSDSMMRDANGARIAELDAIEDDVRCGRWQEATRRGNELMESFDSLDDRQGAMRRAYEECVDEIVRWANATELEEARARAEARAERERAMEVARAKAIEAIEERDFIRAVRDGARAAMDVELGANDEDDDERREIRARARAIAELVRRAMDRETLEACVVDDARGVLMMDSARLRGVLGLVGDIEGDGGETRRRSEAFASVVAEGFLKPLIRAGATRDVRVVEEGEGTLRYETVPMSSVESNGAQESLERALTWIRAKLPNDDVAKAFGDNVWTSVAKTCVESWLNNHPSERAIDRTCAVEVVAANCGFVPPPPDGAASYAGGALGPLEAQALATEMRAAEMRRAAVLAKARALALDDEHQQTLMRSRPQPSVSEDDDAKIAKRVFGVGRGTGDERGIASGMSLLDGAPCTVSKSADDLATHADDVLRAATEDIDPTAHRASANLAAAAADCLDLFRACISSQRAEQLQTIHTAALVFHNDCHHVANRFSASVFARGVALQQRIGRTPALLWPIVPLRALGDATRNAANDRALAEIHAALDLAGGFLHSGEVKVKNTIAKAVARARHVINRAGTASMYLLPEPLGMRDAADLASHYARRVTLEVLSLEDISVEESEALTEIIADAFATDHLVGARGDDDASPALIAAIGAPWLKAREIGIMLSAPLRDIAANWERGAYSPLGFAPREIRALVDALFEDSPLRRECAMRIVPL